MRLTEYIDRMKDLDTPIGIIGIALLAAFLIFIIVNMIKGMRNGLWRQLVHTITTLASAIISYIISLILSNNIVGALSENSFDGIIDRLNEIQDGLGNALRDAIANINFELIEHIALLPATIILIPILTVVIFLALRVILGIVRIIITKVLGFKKSKNNTQRLIGASLGAVEAIIWITIILLPITGIVSLADSAFVSAIENSTEENKAELEDIYDNYIVAFTQNPAITFVDKVGSRPIYNGIATVKLYGEKVNLRDEILEITDIVLSEIPILQDADFKNPNAREKQAIDKVIEVIYDSPFMSTLMVGILQSSSHMIQNDVIEIEMGGNYQDLFNDLLAYLESISKGSLEEDLNTIKSLYFAIADSGVLEAALNGGDLMELLQERRREGDDTVKKIIEILQANERTAPLVTSLTEALIATLSNNIELGEDVTITYDEIKDGMNDVLSVDKEEYETEEEYMEVLTETLDTTLRDNGIELEPEIVDDIAEYVDANYSEMEELTDEQFNDVLLHYYDAYLDYLENGEIPEGTLPEDLIPEGGLPEGE